MGGDRSGCRWERAPWREEPPAERVPSSTLGALEGFAPWVADAARRYQDRRPVLGT